MFANTVEKRHLERHAMYEYNSRILKGNFGISAMTETYSAISTLQ
jgi:hypothetical protein